MQTSATMTGTRRSASAQTPLRGGRRIRVDGTMLNVATSDSQLRVIHPATKANVIKFRGDLESAPLTGAVTAALRVLLRAEAVKGISHLTLKVKPHGAGRWAVSLEYRTADGERACYPEDGPIDGSAGGSAVLDQLDAVPVSADPTDWVRVTRALLRLAVARHGDVPDAAEQIAATKALWHPLLPTPRPGRAH